MQMHLEVPTAGQPVVEYDDSDESDEHVGVAAATGDNCNATM